MNWVIENKEWVFSGIGVFIISFIATLILKSRYNKQSQKLGNQSTGIQVGGDISIKYGDLDGKK
jgi:hypothetical protein